MLNQRQYCTKLYLTSKAACLLSKPQASRRKRRRCTGTGCSCQGTEGYSQDHRGHSYQRLEAQLDAGAQSNIV